MDQASRAKSVTRVLGSVLIVVAVLVALISNDTYQWAIGVPVVLAIVGVGLRIEAVLTSRSG